MLVAPGEHDVVALDGRVEEQFRVVAGGGVEAAATLHPVVALVAHQKVGVVATDHEVVALAGEDFGRIDADEDRVLAAPAHQDVDAVRVGDDVVAVLALEEVAGIAGIGDDVVARPAVHEIDAGARLDPVVACIPPDSVIAEIGDDGVVAIGAAHQHVLAAGKAEVVAGGERLIERGRIDDGCVEVGGRAGDGLPGAQDVAGAIAQERVGGRIVAGRLRRGQIGPVGRRRPHEFDVVHEDLGIAAAGVADLQAKLKARKRRRDDARCEGEGAPLPVGRLRQGQRPEGHRVCPADRHEARLGARPGEVGAVPDLEAVGVADAGLEGRPALLRERRAAPQPHDVGAVAAGGVDDRVGRREEAADAPGDGPAGRVRRGVVAVAVEDHALLAGDQRQALEAAVGHRHRLGDGRAGSEGEAPVGTDPEHRRVQHVRLGQRDAELGCIRLEIGPGDGAAGAADPILAAVDERARGAPVRAVAPDQGVDRGVEAARALVGRGAGIVAHDLAEAHRLQHGVVSGRVAAGGGAVLVELVGGVHLQLEVVIGEGIDADMAGHDVVRRAADAVRPRQRQARIGEHDFREGVLLQLVEEVLPLDTAEIVEPVGILQVLHLGFEDGVEGRAQHAAERHLLLGQAADPEIDRTEARFPSGPAPARIEVVEAIRRCALAAEDQGHGRVALGRERRRGDNGAVGAVGGDEVHHRERVLQVGRHLHPARVGGEEGRARRGVELGPRLVERRRARIAAAGDVDGGEIERQAEQVVAQGADDELVDFAAAFDGHAAHDRGRALVVGQAAVVVERQRIEEGVDQAEAGVERLPVRPEPRHVLGQHRVAEAVDRIGELGEDRRVDLGHRVEHERIDQRLDLAGEFLEDEVLVLHLGGEARRLEQPLTVPGQRIGVGELTQRRHLREVARQGRDVGCQPIVDEGQIARLQDRELMGVDLPVVLGMEDVVDRGEADILVAAPVAGDEVPVEKLVVVFEIAAGLRVHLNRIARERVGIGPEHAVHGDRHRVVGDVVEERVEGAGRCDRLTGLDDVLRAVGTHQHGANGKLDRRELQRLGEAAAGVDGLPPRPHSDHHLRQAVGTADKLAVGIYQQLRDGRDVGVRQFDAEDRPRLELDVRPSGEASVRAAEQAPGRDGPPVHKCVFAQEHLVGGVRGVGLVLVDEGCRDIALRTLDLRGARQRHEAQMRREVVGSAGEAVLSEHERIVGGERDVDGAVPALGDQIETVVEELAEEGHPGIERLRQPLVGRDVEDIDGAVGDGDAGLLQQRIEVRLQDRVIAGRVRGLGGLQGLVRCRDGALIGDDVLRTGDPERRGDGGRVVERGIDHEVRDDPRVGIGDRTGQPVIGVRDDRSARSERHRVPVRVVEVGRLEELRHRLAG